MMRRKGTNPANGAAGSSSLPGYGGVGPGVQYGGASTYGTTSNHGGYSSAGGGYGVPAGGGGGGYGNDSLGGNGGTSYSGYGSSSYSSSGGGAGSGGSSSGFGVASGGSYSDAAYTPSKSLKSKKKMKGAAFNPLTIFLDKFVLACLVSFLLFCVTLYYRSQYNKILEKFHVHSIMDAVKSYEKLEREKKKFEREAVNRDDQTKTFKDTIRTLEKQNRDLRKQADTLKVKFDNSGGMGLEEVEKLKGREEAWRKQVMLLQNATQRESKRAVMERFGPGPHHVLFTVQIPNEQTTSTFRIELAPLDDMPHANHLFLQQVYHELWDNTWFYLNGPHVLQAGPQDWEEETAGQSLQRFTDTQLDTLAFPEYSYDFPHVPWTLGFTGRPGGPDWYINKVDNTKPHGPGGQFQHGLEEQADSCFAKIVDGQATLTRIFASEVYPRNSEYAFFLHEPVEIISARIQEPVQDGVQKPKTNNGGAAQNNAMKVPKKPQRVTVNQETRDSTSDELAAGGSSNEATPQDNNPPSP